MFISCFLALWANQEIPSLTVENYVNVDRSRAGRSGLWFHKHAVNINTWFHSASYSTLPFCLRTDRSFWRKCMHSSIFPFCIQSNMSPPLTEHTGIGCMVMGARKRPAAVIPADRDCGTEAKISSSDEALQHHKVKRDGRSSFAAK